MLIITLCRFEHFRRCITSLSQCTHADKTDLIISLDYPLRESHWEGYRKIDAYLDQIQGFNSVKVVKRQTNYGAIENYFESRKEVLEQYDRLIFTEDDNEFSVNFLDYLNKGLNLYENDSRVYAVCGYNYPLEMPESYSKPYYFSKTFSAWGYGIWRNRLRTEHYSAEDIALFMKDWKHAFAAYQMAPQKILTLLMMIKRNLPLYGDGVVSLENIIKGTLCIFPAVSKVRNHGHDGSGVHCGDLNGLLYSSQTIDSNACFNFQADVPLATDREVSNTVKRFFNLDLKQRLICLALLPIIARAALLKSVGTTANVGAPGSRPRTP